MSYAHCVWALAYEKAHNRYDRRHGTVAMSAVTFIALSEHPLDCVVMTSSKLTILPYFALMQHTDVAFHMRAHTH
jgi:hypothetical protein